MIQPLLEVRAKKVQNFVGFLEDGRTWYFAFDIYGPLGRSKYTTNGERIAGEVIF